MIVKIADKSGVCFGVKRALNTAYDATLKSKNIYSYGQLIHNNQVTNELEKQGLQEIQQLDDISNCDLLIRSHGVGKEVFNLAKGKSINVIDCTCPYVSKVQKIVNKYYNKGYNIIIVGNYKHPEIIGINGWCDNSAIVINNDVETPILNNNNKYCIVAQTTLSINVWNDVISKLKVGIVDMVVYNTICSATSQRQISADKLAHEVDCMIVIGGYHSSNTIKLYEICKKICSNTIHIEKKSDLVVTNIKNCGTIGITAGASTPDWVVDEIFNFLKALK